MGSVLTARIGLATLPGLPGLEFGCHCFTEILRSEDGTDFDIRIRQHGVRAAFDPFDRLLDRPDLPDPKARDQFLGLRERAVSHRACLAGEAHALAVPARLQPFPR